MKEKINSIQLVSAFILMIVSSSIGLSLYTTIRVASIDSYICVLVGSLLGIIPFIIFLYIFNYEKDKPLHEKINLVFGKVVGTILNALITIIYFIIGITVIFNLSNFVVSQYLADTPLLLILLTIGLVIYHALNKGIETITRASSIFILIVLFLFTFSFAYLIREMNLDNLKPILEFGIQKPLWGAFLNMLITLAPIFSILIIPKDNLVDKEKFTKYGIVGYLISAIIIFLVSFMSNAILGKYLTKLYQYPGYISLKRISLFGFIDRIENFLSFHWILGSFINLAIILYFLKGNIKRGKNSKIVNLILCLATIFISYKIFYNNTVFNNYTYHIYPYILMILFSIFIILAIGIFIKKKIKN